MNQEVVVPRRERFLLVSASTAGARPATRVRVWRKLRSLGALYLHQSVCLLPDRKPVRRQVQRLLASVRADGGTARSLTVTVDDEAEYAGLVAEFNAERDAEYAEVVERAPQLLAELETSPATRAPVAQIDAEAAARVRAAWELGLDEGATCIAGGDGDASELVLPPTVFTNVEAHMQSARRQEPLPVLCLMRSS